MLHFFILYGFLFLNGGQQPFITNSVNTPLNVTSDSLATTGDSAKEARVRFMMLPIIFSSPDTRLAGGVLPQVVFRMPGSSFPTSVRLDAYYTQNRQYHLLLRPNFWLFNDNWNINGKFSFKKWPTSFYGIGNDTDKEDEEKFTEKLIEISLETKRRVGDGLYGGLTYGVRYGNINPDNLNGRLTDGSIPGSDKSLTSSIGFTITRDTRDNHFYPTSGSYHRLSLTTASKLLGSDYTFTQIDLDLRTYLAVFHEHVLAIQGNFIRTGGDLPFRMGPSVGGLLRGYSSVRYIDRNLAGLQAEYRVVPVVWRIGVIAFAGVADVFDRFSDIQFDRLKYSVGIGLRYQFSRAERINIRYDYGFGRNVTGDYLDLNEAF